MYIDFIFSKGFRPLLWGLLLGGLLWAQLPTLHAQVYEGDLEFSSQEEVNTFAYTEVTGDLEIIHRYTLTDITDLTPLSQLISVGGNLTIKSSGSLISLHGLENLESVQGNLTIECDYLTSLQVLANLKSVKGDLTIKCNSLTSLHGLESFHTITGDLYIGFSNTLTDLSGLDNLNSVEGRFSLWYNKALTSLEGLNNLRSVGGTLNISGNAPLISFESLRNLNYVGGILLISSHDSLASLEGLENLNSLSGDLYIGYNRSLTNLEGLTNLRTIEGKLKIDNNYGLINLQGMESLSSIGGDMIIEHNNALISLQGLETLNTVAGDITVKDHYELVDLQGLVNLTSVGGNLKLESNQKLRQSNYCGIYPLLKSGGVAGYFSATRPYKSENDILGNEACAAQFACSLSIAEIIQQDESCIGAHDGQLLVYDEGEGGGGAFPEYSKDGGLSWQPNGLFANLSPGDYQIVVRFPNMPSCSTAIQTKTIQAGTNPRPTLTATTTKSNCLGDTDGTITLTANRPAGSHLFYSLNDEPFLAGGPTYTYIHQGAGDHRVIVKDLNDCISEVLEVRLKAHERPTFKALAKQDATGELTEDGIIHIEPLTSGFAPYTYSLDDGATYLADPDLTFGADFGGLNPGEYDIRIQDKNGCISEHRHITVNDLSQCTTRTALANKYNFVYSGNTEAAYVCEGNLFQQKYTVSNLADGERFRLDWVIEETFGEVNEHSTFNEMIPTPDAIRGSQGPYSTGGNYTFDAGGGILGMEDYAKHNDTMHFTLTPVIILPNGQECHGNPVDEYAYVYPGGRIRLQNAQQPGQTIVIASGAAPNGTFEAIPATQLIGLPLIYNIDIAPTQGITELTDGFGSTESDLTTTYGQDEYKLYGLTNTTAEPVKVTVNVTPVVDQWTSSVDIHCEGESQSIDIWVLPGS